MSKGKPPGLTLQFDDEEEDRRLAELAKKEPVVSINGTVYAGTVMISTTSCTLGGRTMTLDPQSLVAVEGTSSRLGSGSSGSVKKMRHTVTGQIFAVKEIRINSEHHLREIQKELETLHQESTSQHKNLVEFYGAYSMEGCVYIVMECMDGSLAELKQIPEVVLAKVAKQVLTGLQYLHTNRHLIHRDIKPSNLLYRRNGVVKITDFGVSSQLENTQGVASSFVGTVTYMSPERLRGDAHGSVGDIWALGISLAELAMGFHPFKPVVAEDALGSAKFWSLLSHLSNQGRTLDLSMVASSDEFKDFIDQCCEKDPAKRASARDLLDHPWISRNCASEEEDERVIERWLQEKLPAVEGSRAAASNNTRILAALDALVDA